MHLQVGVCLCMGVLTLHKVKGELLRAEHSDPVNPELNEQPRCLTCMQTATLGCPDLKLSLNSVA